MNHWLVKVNDSVVIQACSGLLDRGGMHGR